MLIMGKEIKTDLLEYFKGFKVLQRVVGLVLIRSQGQRKD